MAISSALSTLSESPLDTLTRKATARKLDDLDYSGEVLPKEAIAFFAGSEGLLVDVRTQPEWQFVGVADLSQTHGKLATISWKTYPGFAPNPQFVAQLNSAAAGDKNLPLFFICRSGGRSLDAAVAMTEAGYLHCFNIAGGFEGEPDVQGRRGTQDGWKAAKLPWKQG